MEGLSPIFWSLIVSAIEVSLIHISYQKTKHNPCKEDIQEKKTLPSSMEVGLFGSSFNTKISTALRIGGSVVPSAADIEK